MLKRLSEWLPTVTVAALAISALFNIAFFGRVGIHFLGVMDLTNVIYTFALAFSLVFAVAGLAIQHFIETHGKQRDYEKEFKSFSSISLVLKIALVAAFAIQFYPPALAFIRSFSSQIAYSLALFFVGALLSANRAYLGYRGHGVLFKGEILTAALFSSLTISGAGVYVAHTNMFDSPTYRITTKNGAFDGTRIVRSSSLGFLIATDGVIRFIPAGEITEIKADRSIQP